MTVAYLDLYFDNLFYIVMYTFWVLPVNYRIISKSLKLTSSVVNSMNKKFHASRKISSRIYCHMVVAREIRFNNCINTSCITVDLVVM